MITFTKEQLSAVICNHAEKENGLHDYGNFHPKILAIMKD